MRLSWSRFLFPAVLLGVLVLWGCKHQKADLLIINGTVHTLDPENEIAQAIAIQDGKIIEVGQTEDLMYDYAAEEILDLRGRPVYPGFIDPHCHFFGYANMLSEVDLKGCKSWKQVVDRTAAFGKTHTEGWLIGRGWDQTKWTSNEFPTKKSLDSLYPSRPVFLVRIDGHAGVANQTALDEAGITGKTRVKGGKVITSRGRPTGMVVDQAMDLIRDVIPEPAPDQMRERLTQAERNCFEVGLTTLGEAGLDKSQIELLEAMQSGNQLKMRFYAMANPGEEELDYYLNKGPVKSDRMQVSAIKIYADGALGSRGACLLKPYKDDRANYGFMLEDLDYYREIASQIFEAGFQMNTHCIGDSANRFILKVYNETLGETQDRRWRIEHAQVIHPEDFHRFGKNGIIPSVQPTHATSDKDMAKNRIGKDRLAAGAYAYKRLLAENGLIAFGSDFPVEGINPLLGFYAAVARTDTAGQPYGGFLKQEAVSRDTALKAMTIWAAYANFQEDTRGSIEPGKFADLVVLEEDILYIDLEKVPTTPVHTTLVNGEIVYRRDD